MRLTPDERGVKIENRNCFAGTEAYTFVYRMLKDGECVFERAVKTSVPPLGEKYIPLAWPETADSGEYVYEVSALSLIHI